MILCLILSGCSKNINIDKYTINKEYSSSEENNSKKENENKKEEYSLKKAENNISEEDIKGQNLIEAIISKDKVRVIEALKEGANVNYKNRKGNTPLIYAARNYNESILEILLEAGADISEIPIFDNRFTWISSKSKLLELLIKKGYIDVNSRDDEGRTFMNVLCCTGVLSFLRALSKNRVLSLLINKGTDFDTRDIYGNTPLLNLAKRRSHYNCFTSQSVR